MLVNKIEWYINIPYWLAHFILYIHYASNPHCNARLYSHYKKQIWHCIFRASFWHNFSMQEGLLSLETLILFCTIRYNIILYSNFLRQNTIQCYSVIEWNKIFWKLHNTDTFVSWLFFIVWIFFSSIFSSINLLYIAK